MVRDEGGAQVPELVRRMALHAPSIDPVVVMVQTLLRLAERGITLGDVLADCGYSGPGSRWPGVVLLTRPLNWGSLGWPRPAPWRD
jgi:hypothetical protein